MTIRIRPCDSADAMAYHVGRHTMEDCVVYLVFTRAGYEALLTERPAVEGLRLRVNEGVLADHELADWRARGVDVACLPEAVDPRREGEVVAAVEAVEAEFPEEPIEVEYA